MYRPRVSILRAKQLKELELKEKLKVAIKFAEKNIGKYYKIIAR